MVKRSVIAIDVDDVLVPTNEAIRLFINEHFGTNYSHEDHTQPGEYRGYFERLWNVNPEEADHRYAAFVESGKLQRTQPLEGAIQVIKELKKAYELVIVTARSDEQTEITHQWLLKHFPGVFTGVHFQPAWYRDKGMTKAAICKEIGASYLVDDNVEHCTMAEQEGIKALLFGEYGWSKENKDAQKLTRVHDWYEVKKYFDEVRKNTI